MDKKTFICNYFIHAEGNDMESMRAAAEQRAKVLEEMNAFAEYRASGSAPAGQGQDKKDYSSGEMKDPKGPPSEKQIETLARMFGSRELRQIFEQDEYIMKNNKMAPDVLGKFVDGRYVGKYTKKNASDVVGYVFEKVDFHKKIGAMMKALGKSEVEVQAELDRFCKTPDKQVWADVLKAIETAQTSAAPAASGGDEDPF